MLGGTGVVPVSQTVLTEPIHDFTWMRQLLIGKVRERFALDDYRVVAIEPSEASRSTYHFRMLFFPTKGEKPVLSLNLETSILGSPCLTEHFGGRHTNLGPADVDLSYAKFREWAVAHAEELLA